MSNADIAMRNVEKNQSISTYSRKTNFESVYGCAEVGRRGKKICDNVWNVNRFYLPPRIRLLLAMTQHCVSCYVHWISCYVIADMLQSKWNGIEINSQLCSNEIIVIGRLPIWHVIVFAAPSPKRIWKTIHGSELFHRHGRYAAKNGTVWQSGSECERNEWKRKQIDLHLIERESICGRTWSPSCRRQLTYVAAGRDTCTNCDRPSAANRCHGKWCNPNRWFWALPRNRCSWEWPDWIVRRRFARPQKCRTRFVASSRTDEYFSRKSANDGHGLDTEWRWLRDLSHCIRSAWMCHPAITCRAVVLPRFPTFRTLCPLRLDHADRAVLADNCSDRTRSSIFAVIALLRCRFHCLT